jgi:hypothetical protein
MRVQSMMILELRAHTLLIKIEKVFGKEQPLI